MNEQTPLSFEDLSFLIKSLPDDIDLVVIGGQALSFWANFYYEKFPEIFNSTPGIVLGTSDIDFKATKEAAEKCAEAWNAKIEYPDQFNSTANTAIAFVELPGKGEVTIDFLSDFQKLPRQKKNASTTTPLSSEKSISVLSPLATLTSKLANIIVLRRDDNHSLGQLRTAILILKCHLEHQIEIGQHRDAGRQIKMVLRYAKNNSIGRFIWREHSISILNFLPDNLPDLDARFLSHYIHPEIEEVKLILTPDHPFLP
jgi:hypothetical protein